MVERPWTGQLPPVHPDPYGRLPQPDGQTVPHRLAAPVPSRWPGWVVAVVVLVLMAAGIAGVTL